MKYENAQPADYILVFGVGLIVLIERFLEKNEIPTNIDTILLIAGVLIIAIVWGIERFYQWRHDNKLRGLLIYEMHNNLLTINDTIYLVKQAEKGEASDIIFYLNNEVFNALINSNKVFIAKEEAIGYLFSFNNMVKTIHRLLSEVRTPKELFESKFHRDFLFRILKVGKYSLKQALTELGKEKIYEESKLKGKIYTLQEEEIIESFDEVLNHE